MGTDTEQARARDIRVSGSRAPLTTVEQCGKTEECVCSARLAVGLAK